MKLEKERVQARRNSMCQGPEVRGNLDGKDLQAGGVRDKARWIGSSQIIMCLVQQGCTYIILKCAKK